MNGCRSDAVFMLPPFLAYYGVITDNKTVVDQAYNQIRL
jgi:rhamnogalacturonyl hydrolase YesR